MSDRMRVLCLCNGGNTRSSTLARMLRRRGFEAIAAGVDEHFSDKTLLMLLDWCHVAYIQRDAAYETLGQRPGWTVQPSVLGQCNFQFADRNGYLSFKYDVGLDDWQVMDHPDLVRRFKELLDAP